MRRPKGRRTGFESPVFRVNTWWSWVLFVNGAFGLWLYTVRPKIGPVFNIVAQVVWFTYGIVTQQWGFLASSTTNAAIFSWMLWRAYRPKEGNRTGEEPVSKAGAA